MEKQTIELIEMIKKLDSGLEQSSEHSSESGPPFFQNPIFWQNDDLALPYVSLPLLEGDYQLVKYVFHPEEFGKRSSRSIGALGTSHLKGIMVFAKGKTNKELVMHLFQKVTETDDIDELYSQLGINEYMMEKEMSFYEELKKEEPELFPEENWSHFIINRDRYLNFAKRFYETYFIGICKELFKKEISEDDVFEYECTYKLHYDKENSYKEIMETVNFCLEHF